MGSTALEKAKTAEYEARRDVAAMRDGVFAGREGAATIEELKAAEAALATLEKQRAKLEVGQGEGVVISTAKNPHLLGAESTGIVATVTLRMAQVPTAVYHLFRKDAQPLISGQIANQSNEKIRRLRVTSQIDDYSVPAIDTLEVKQNQPQTFDQLPALRPERTRELNELSRASVSVLVEDLDKPGTGVELHRTDAIWMLARTTAPFAVKDPSTGGWNDLTKYFGAFVTPNDPAVMAFLSDVREAHPKKTLVGYQAGVAGVDLQIRAIYAALKAKGVHYVNSTTAFAPEEGTVVQRVRLPAETLGNPNANCIDGTVLFASIIEAMSLNAAIVTLPGHAIVAWEPARGSGNWAYLDTTLIGDNGFEAAHARGEEFGSSFAKQFETNTEPKYHRWSIRELRGMGITPTQ